MFASGMAALGYQIVWTQQASLWLGHESAGVLAVVAAFFAGLSLGALGGSARIQSSLQPGRWYAACEVAIALWSVVLAVLLAPVGQGLLAAMGPQPSGLWHWTVAFGGSFLLLLPATAAMGATLPAMERALAPWRGDRLAGLYAANTLGAVLGVLAAAFWLVPHLGLTQTAGLCVALNLLCAALAWRLFGRLPPEPLHAPPEAFPTAFPTASPPTFATGSPQGLGLLAATGLLGIGYEVLAVRVLSQVSENTVYTFAMLLAVYLVGTAFGAAAYQRWLSGRAADRALRDGLLLGLAASVGLSGLALWWAPPVKAAWLAGLGLEPSMGTALAAEAGLGALAFLLPTLWMGALFSHLARQAQAGGAGLGRALGMNTLGAAAAPVLVGVMLIPAVGPKVVLLLIVLGYLLLCLGPAWRRPAPWVLAAGVGVAMALAPPLAFVDVPQGGHIVSYQDGAMAAVSVVEDAQGVSRLRIDNRQQEGSSTSLLADARQALLPMLLHPAPKRALFLGLGTGVTASAAAAEVGLQVDAVELLPEVITASSHFTQALQSRWPASNLRVLPADARRFVRTAEQRYDLIVADNFHPARSGSGALYTVEHFQAVRARLAAGGLFCQWLPLHQLDLDTLRSIVASFLVAYPQGRALLATNSLETPVLGLIGNVGRVGAPDATGFDTGIDAGFDTAQVRQRMASLAWPQPLASLGLADEWAVLGSLVAGPSGLREWAGAAPLNTDDRPVVTYRAPRITYAPDSAPRDRLLALLSALPAAPDHLLAPAAAPDTARLQAYVAARQQFLVVGREVRARDDVMQMLAQVREPLLAVLRTSPDFRPAYDPLLGMAMALAPRDPSQARALLAELTRLQPARPEAPDALRKLAAAAP